MDSIKAGKKSYIDNSTNIYLGNPGGNVGVNNILGQSLGGGGALAQAGGAVAQAGGPGANVAISVSGPGAANMAKALLGNFAGASKPGQNGKPQNPAQAGFQAGFKAAQQQEKMRKVMTVMAQLMQQMQGGMGMGMGPGMGNAFGFPVLGGSNMGGGPLGFLQGF